MQIKSFLGGGALVALLALSPLTQADTVDVTDPLPLGTNYWYRTNTYILNGLCHLLGGSVLHIEAGTVIKGRNLGASATQKGGLVVCRNAKIYAEGTPQNPIIFTAEADDVTDPTDLDIYQRGLWGGVVLLGNATVNEAVLGVGRVANPKFELYEGLPDLQSPLTGEYLHRFGGNDDNDSSGVLRYVSIRHGGALIEANKELNGLTLGAVGRGTVIEFVEAYATADDGFEFFGGTVNTRYLVSAFNDDDSFDVDHGHNGKHQFWFGIQAPDKRNYGFELNGEPNEVADDVASLPVSNFELYNLTVIGAGVGNTGTGGNNDTMLIRQHSAPRIHNGVFTDFARRGVEIDARSGGRLTNGTLQLTHNLWWGYTGGANPNSATNLAVVARAEVLFSDTARSNIIADPLLTSVSRTNNGGLDPRPRTGSPALTAAKTPPNDGFFTAVDFKGAFGNVNWASDWTALGNYFILSAAGAGTPFVPSAPPPPARPILAFERSGSDFFVRFQSQAGASYQLQSATNLAAPISWTDEGAPKAGTGGPLTWTNTIGPNRLKVFRVIVP